MLRRVLAVPALVLVALLALATAATAHVELDPGEATAGSTATLSFSFHHGKDGTATTGLEVLLPEGAAVVEVPDVPGWSATVDEAAGTVAWTGGSVPDGTEMAFPLVVQLPAAAGEALFKTIQTTEAGELAWIEEEESEGEGAYPAPRLTLVADPAATTSTSPSSTTTTTEGEPTTTTERRPGTSLEASQRDDGTTSAAPWIIGSGVAAVALVGGGGYLLKRRSG
jgi:periplasmic copper chaperone A